MSAGRIKGIFRWVFFLWLLIHLAKASECFCSLGDSSTPAQSRPNAASEIVGFMKSKTCFNGISQPGMEWIKVDKTEIFIRKHSLTACPDGLAQITSGIHHTRNGFETLKTQKTTNSRLRREERRFLLDSVNHAQCDFEVQSFCSWRNIQGGHDDFDWVLYQSSTPTDDTGPKFDHTLNNATGSYIFIESSAPRNNLDTAWIQSPDIDAKVVPVHCFRFWYHMFGSSIGRLNIYQVTQGILPGNLVWSLTGAQGSTWMEGQVPLSSNYSYSMLISGIVGNGYQGDIAIDDVSVSPGYCDVKPSIASRTHVTNTVNGIWSTWSNYTRCTVTCGGGTRARLRKCEYTPGFQHGDACVGHNNETQQCNNDMCPVDGVIQPWNSWTFCSVSCGGGVHTRTRDCYFPTNRPHGTDCSGPLNETAPCNVQSCPTTTTTPPTTTIPTADGRWSNWTSWTVCTLTCDGGQQYRERQCTYPDHTLHGQYCEGPKNQTQDCNSQNCPRKCNVCRGSPQICEKNYTLEECPADKQFCINELTNKEDASRTVNRRCGTQDECDSGWYQTYSDDDKCTQFDENLVYTTDFYCEYCCNEDGCNKLMNPPNPWSP